jgi:4-hydroxy-tetrahydrodipicolinate synthase
MSQPWRGIFPIVITPFTDSYELDEASLRRVVRFCIDAGARGLVGPANASEFAALSDDERRRWIEIVVSECSGQIPVVAATTSGHALPAVALSRFAQEVGADCVMAMPPHVLHPDAEGCYEYYLALSSVLDIPVMIQNYIGPVGTPMSPVLIARMCRELPQVQYVKEETLPSSRMISATLLPGGVRGHCRPVHPRRAPTRHMRQHARLPDDRCSAGRMGQAGGRQRERGPLDVQPGAAVDQL